MRISVNETTSLTELFTNHEGLFQHILSNETLKTADHWLTGYR